MVRFSGAAASLLALSAVSGCGSTGLFDRDRPDEFAVQRQAPLVVPPDFALVPPAPGTQITGGGQNDVLDALFGGPAPRSESEAALIGAAGTGDPGIRSSVGDPDTQVLSKGSTTRDIIAAPEGAGAAGQATVP